jgi:hypothetical protein
VERHGRLRSSGKNKGDTARGLSRQVLEFAEREETEMFFTLTGDALSDDGSPIVIPAADGIGFRCPVA